MDYEALANIVMDVCYNNTKYYFGFEYDLIEDSKPIDLEF
jgi:hypothetical protein